MGQVNFDTIDEFEELEERPELFGMVAAGNLLET